MSYGRGPVLFSRSKVNNSKWPAKGQNPTSPGVTSNSFYLSHSIMGSASRPAQVIMPS
jgi:hypothetical protein